MSAIKEYSGEYVIQGKDGMVSWMGDYWDIWLTGIHKGKEFSQRKVNFTLKRIEGLVKSVDQELNGEITAKVQDNEGAFLVAVLLGARRKRKASPNSLKALRKARLEKVS